MRLRHLRLTTVLTINPEPRLWKGKLIVRGITAAKYLLIPITTNKTVNKRKRVIDTVSHA